MHDPGRRVLCSQMVPKAPRVATSALRDKGSQKWSEIFGSQASSASSSQTTLAGRLLTMGACARECPYLSVQCSLQDRGPLVALTRRGAHPRTHFRSTQPDSPSGWESMCASVPSHTVLEDGEEGWRGREGRGGGGVGHNLRSLPSSARPSLEAQRESICLC